MTNLSTQETKGCPTGEPGYKSRYDYLVVGAGLAGATVARKLAEAGKEVLVIEKRSHVAGNAHTEINKFGDVQHMYGSHIFHTGNEEVWNFLSKFTEWTPYKHSVIADDDDRCYHMPLSARLFEEFHGVGTYQDHESIIAKEIEAYGKELDLTTVEGFAISKVGTTIYNHIIKNYTEKQWERSCSELPSSIVKRLTFRDSFDNDYFPESDTYQALPKAGYTQMVQEMLAHKNIDLRLETDFFKHKQMFEYLADHVIYTGPVDMLFNYAEGRLDYRSLRFEDNETDIWLNTPVVNYTGKEIKATREHVWNAYMTDSHSTKYGKGKTLVTYEFSQEYSEGMEPYYPINDKKNMDIYKRYYKHAKELSSYSLVGRLAEYKYYDMDDAVARALNLSKRLLANDKDNV
jgi:UDP-galactopyranose mutase